MLAFHSTFSFHSILPNFLFVFLLASFLFAQWSVSSFFFLIQMKSLCLAAIQKKLPSGNLESFHWNDSRAFFQKFFGRFHLISLPPLSFDLGDGKLIFLWHLNVKKSSSNSHLLTSSKLCLLFKKNLKPRCIGGMPHLYILPADIWRMQ